MRNKGTDGGAGIKCMWGLLRLRYIGKTQLYLNLISHCFIYL